MGKYERGYGASLPAPTFQVRTLGDVRGHNNRRTMKRKFFCLLLAMSCSVCGFAQQTDPLLTGAVTTQTEMLKKLFKKREKTQEAIIATEAGVTLAMERMHHLEDKMLGYLQNAQGAMQNIYQIKRAAELVGMEIPQNMALLRKSLPGNLKGTAIAVMVSEELVDASAQMLSLYPFMSRDFLSRTWRRRWMPSSAWCRISSVRTGRSSSRTSGSSTSTGAVSVYAVIRRRGRSSLRRR